MRVKLIRNTFINGKFAEEGEILDINEPTGRLLILSKKAEPVKEVKKDNQMTTKNTETVETKKKGKSKKK